MHDEGQTIVVPLGKERYVLGLIARRTDTTSLGYFFGRVYDSVPETLSNNMTGKYAVLVTLLNTKSIEKENWDVLPPLENWNREEWIAPVFADEEKEGTVYVHDDDTLELQETITDMPYNPWFILPPAKGVLQAEELVTELNRRLTSHLN